MTRTDTTDVSRPGAWARFRSRQSGCPSGPVGRLFGRLMVPTTAPANDAAIDALDLAIPSVVLEVGFGQGRTVARLAAFGHQVIGIDPSATMVRQARAHNRRAIRAGTVRLDAGDGIHLPLDDDIADAALTVHTIYFMDEPATTARRDRSCSPSRRHARPRMRRQRRRSRPVERPNRLPHAQHRRRPRPLRHRRIRQSRAPSARPTIWSAPLLRTRTALRIVIVRPARNRNRSSARRVGTLCPNT